MNNIIMKKIMTMLAAILCCTMMTAVLTACTDDDSEGQSSGVELKIVGNWCSDVSGKTCAKWNYGETWQTTEFKDDGTGSTRIYYTYIGSAIGIEKIDFTYTASADGTLTMTPTDRDVMKAKWQVVGDQLRLSDDSGSSLDFQKTSSEMAATFDRWSKTEVYFEVPQPAKYTVFVYGNAEGSMDEIIEQGFWERTKTFLADHNNVRVICMYKYGKDLPEEDKPFTGKYAKPGDIVWFELDGETDLTKIKDSGLQAIGMGEEGKALKICDPNTLRLFLEFSSLVCPANEYVLAIWGHGSGYDPLREKPGKYDVAGAPSRGVIGDEWNNGEEMDMFELHDGLRAAGIDHLNTLFFHNCLMGNMETLTQARSFADYIVASSHVLGSDGLLLTEFVRGLMEKGNAEDAAGQMFENSEDEWKTEYSDPVLKRYLNGDYKMIRTDKFDAIIDVAKQLADRLIVLYPTQQEAINRATKQVYRYYPFESTYIAPFFDIADYAHQLAKETGDAELQSISEAMDNAFKEAFIHYRDINNSKQHLDYYTLSVCLVHNIIYNFDFKGNYPSSGYLCNFGEGYVQCDFHQLTGWGNWLDTNQQAAVGNPETGGGGSLK